MDPGAPSVNKRRRVDQGSGPQKHASLWLADGNIVLRAKKTMFRVHKSILSSDSKVFSELFAEARPPDGETFDNLPVIELHDHPQDLADFLHALYHGIKFKAHGTKIPYRRVRSLIRIAAKYSVDYLLQEGICYLQKMLPGDVSQFDSDEGAKLVAFTEADWISVANLTSEMDSRKLHLRALYRCCLLPTSYLTRGVTDPSRGRVERLSENDLIRCLEGRALLTVAKYETIENLFHSTHEDCRSPLRCREMLGAIYSSQRLSASQTIVSPNALENLDSWIDEICDVTHNRCRLCTKCTHGLKVKSAELRQDILRNLRRYFE